MNRTSVCLAAIACFTLCSAAAPTPPGATAQAWVKAFNAQDTAALKAMGDDSPDYNHDMFEETGGLDFMRVEKDDGTNVEALARERLSPGVWRLLLTRDAKDPTHFSDIHLHGEPLATEADALTAMDAFATRLTQKDEFSGVLLVRRDGHDIFAKTYGHADADNKAPVTLDTKFFVASSGKMFTAVAVHQLIEKGRVSLDDTVGKFLPDYPNRDIATKVTVRMLLAHTGGTGDMGILQPEEGANRAKIHSLAEIVALNGARGPDFPPGTKWDYSNYGYILLGAIIEKASGEDYYAYMQKHIFDPAGMTQTSFPLLADMRGIAVPMWPKDGGKLVSAMDMWPWRGGPAGGGVSTAGDEAKFIAGLNDGTLISPKSLAFATHAPGGLGFKEGNGFGFGFIESGVPGNKFWGHGGGAHGDSVVVDYYPKSHVTFVCLANREPAACDRVAGVYLFRWPRSE